jgi:hypothetical protein
LNVRAVDLFWDHLHKNDLEELIDRVVGTTPQTLPAGNLQTLLLALHRCGGLAVLLSQPNPFCMRRMSPQQAATLTTACVRFLQECFALVISMCMLAGVLSLCACFRVCCMIAMGVSCMMLWVGYVHWNGCSRYNALGILSVSPWV